jgi:hypothetical protein
LQLNVEELAGVFDHVLGKGSNLYQHIVQKLSFIDTKKTKTPLLILADFSLHELPLETLPLVHLFSSSSRDFSIHVIGNRLSHRNVDRKITNTNPMAIASSVKVTWIYNYALVK